MITIILNIMSAFCLTAGERAENHVGMQMIGNNNISEHGFNNSDLSNFLSILQNIQPNLVYEHVSLVESLKLTHEDIIKFPELIQTPMFSPASILIIRNGLNILMNDNNAANNMYYELYNLKWDDKYYDTRRSKVLNKRARHNLVFDDTSQEPDYINKKGRIYAYNQIPTLEQYKSKLEQILGISNMVIEGNNYYDIKRTGIGFHGDTERKKVIAISLGEWRELHYSWYYKYKALGNKIEFKLYHGDLYIMSEKTSGYDWKTKNIPTLRHAAGRMDGPAKKYLTRKS